MKKIATLFVFFLSAFLSAFAAETVLGVWGDAGRYSAVSIDGKNYFLQTESGRYGPFLDIKPKTRNRTATNRAFIVEEKDGTFLVSASGEHIGPFDFVYDDDNSGRLFIAKHADKQIDIYFDDGQRLILRGTTFMAADDTGCGVSADGLHSWVHLKDMVGQPEAVLFDGAQLQMIASAKNGLRSYGFIGPDDQFWALAEQRFSGYLLAVLTPAKDGTMPLVSTLSAEPAAAATKNLIPYPELLLGGAVVKTADGRVPLTVARMRAYERSANGKYLAMKFLSGGNWYVYDGAKLYGPFDDAKGDDNKITVADNGKTTAYVTYATDAKTGKFGYLVWKNGVQLGFHDGSGIAALKIAEDSLSCVYIVNEYGGKQSVWVDGKLLATDCDKILLRSVESWYGAATFGTKKESTYRGHIQVEKGGTVSLYALDKPLAGPYEGTGLFYVQGVSASPVVNFAFNRFAGASPTQIVMGDKKIDLPNSMIDIALSSTGSSFACNWTDAKQNCFVYTSDGKTASYQQACPAAFIPGTERALYFFRQGSAWFAGGSDGSKFALPGFGFSDTTKIGLAHPVISLDGRTIEYPSVKSYYWPVMKKNSLLDSTGVLIDGVAYVGSYNPDAKVTVYWNDKTKKVERILH